MSEVMLVSAAMMIAGAILMALFLPSRAPQDASPLPTEERVSRGVRRELALPGPAPKGGSSPL